MKRGKRKEKKKKKKERDEDYFLFTDFPLWCFIQCHCTKRRLAHVVVILSLSSYISQKLERISHINTAICSSSAFRYRYQSGRPPVKNQVRI